MRYLLLLCGLLLWVTACSPDENDSREPTPTVPPPITITATTPPSPTVSPTPSGPTATASVTFPPTLTPSLTATIAPPTNTLPPPPPPGPFEYVVEAGDDCLTILFKHGHPDNAALYDFFALNDLPGRCILGPPGTVVRVPRPILFTPVVNEAGEVVPTNTPAFAFVPGYDEYCTVEGDTLTSIALKSDTTLRLICALNPLPDGLDCTGCNFSESDVGFCPNPPLISTGKCLRILGSTATPTATLPPTGEETVTPTPTLRAPQVVRPFEGQTVNGIVRLQWVSVGILQPDQYYVVHLTNQTTTDIFIRETQSTSLEIAPEFFSRTSEPQTISWYVAVERKTAEGLFEPDGGRSTDYTFTYQ